MKPYLKQTVGTDPYTEIQPPAEGYYLAFANLHGHYWHLIWAPFA